MEELKVRSIKLGAARHNTELTQEEAAEKLRITRYKLARYERGIQVVPLDVAWRMSKLYGVPVQCLDPGGDTFI